MAEHVELPRRRRRRPEYVALKPDAVHEVPNRGLRTGQVRVGLVVGAAHHLDAPLGDEPQQVGAILGVGVEVRLEVVDLGEDESVLRLAAGHLQVRGHQREGVVLLARAGRVLGPQAGVGALGVPPHRVVVEVADHVHGPARFGILEFEDELDVRRRRPGQHPRRAAPPRHRIVDPNRDLDHPLARRGNRRVGSAQPVTLGPDCGGHSRIGVLDPHDLHGLIGIADKQFGGLDGADLHFSKSTRAGTALSGTVLVLGGGQEMPRSRVRPWRLRPARRT